jgi:hypothetical protein
LRFMWRNSTRPRAASTNDAFNTIFGKNDRNTVKQRPLEPIINADGRACSLGYGLVMGDVFSSRGIELKINVNRSLRRFQAHRIICKSTPQRP